MDEFNKKTFERELDYLRIKHIVHGDNILEQQFDDLKNLYDKKINKLIEEISRLNELLDACNEYKNCVK